MKLARTIIFVVTAALLGGIHPAIAQTAGDSKPADNMQILRDKLKADKKALVASNMDLTEAEAKGFWPVYDAYQKDLESINKRTVEMIRSYADAWNAKALDNEKAKKLTTDFLAITGDEAKLMQSYAPKLGKVLPATKVALYLQLENKIRTIVKFDLMQQVPLMPGK